MRGCRERVVEMGFRKGRVEDYVACLVQERREKEIEGMRLKMIWLSLMEFIVIIYDYGATVLITVMAISVFSSYCCLSL